jgi:hypothetical protein
MALQRVEDCYPTDELVEELTGGGVLLVGAFGSSLRNVVNQAAYTATGGTDSAPLESLNVVSLHSTLCSRLFRQRRSDRSACGIPIAVLWAETKQTSFGSRPATASGNRGGIGHTRELAASFGRKDGYVAGATLARRNGGAGLIMRRQWAKAPIAHSRRSRLACSDRGLTLLQ